jgi:HAD superfamily hydrolase (TIGR01509 family)
MAAPVYKALIFDCFGVLVSGARSRLAIDHPDKAQAIYDLNKQSDYGYLTKQAYDEQLGELLGIDPANIDALLVPSVVRNEELLTFIRELRQTYKTAVLSNVGPEWFEQFFNETEQTDFFDDIVLSYKLGMAKPQPEIFYYTCEKLGVSPEECIFVDDTVDNVRAAEAVGMYGIVHRDFMQTSCEIQSILE